MLRKKNKVSVNSEPWNIDFWERLKRIQNNSGKKRVVYIYEKADTSTFRYRVYNMCQALDSSKDFVGSYFFEYELDQISEYLGTIDILVIVRTRWTIEIDAFIQKAKNKRIPVLFDIDDLVFNIEKLPIVMNTLNVQFEDPGSYNFWFAYASRLWIMGKICDATIGTNKYICDRLSNYYKKPSYVVNNFLNQEQIEISDKLYQSKIGEKSKKRKSFRIGYFSGTPSHINDFKKVAPEIGSLLTKYQNMTLEVVGFMEFPDFLQKFVKKGQITHSPLVDFLTLQEKISQSDVNIIPLVENEFTNCKSELKFFEAAIVGTVTCATPTYVYKNNIQNEQTGFLCVEGLWCHTIEKIYKNEIDKNLIKNAREYCINKYSPRAQLASIEKMLNTNV